MTFLDKAKETAAQAKEAAEGLAEKAKEVVAENADKIEASIDKAGDFIDEKTGGQYADKVDLAQEKVKQVADDLDQAN